MDGFVVKSIEGSAYISLIDDVFAWNFGPHAFVESHLFESEEQAEAIAAQFGGRVLYVD